MTTDLTEKFVRLMTEAHGSNGAKWLAELPEIIGEIEAKWSLRVGAPFENLSYHFVAPCVGADGGMAVVKIGFPEANSPIFNEAEMLKLYGGNGAVNFLKIDKNRLALLLEKLDPGKHLKDVFQKNEEEKAVETAIEVLQKIRRKPPPTHRFIRLESWFAGFERARTTSFPTAPIEKAQKFYQKLSAAESFLLHGDFHHENILSAGRGGFLAIDPKGIVGQLGYEISVFLNNHVCWRENDARVRERLNHAVLQFSQAFEIEPQILRQWAYAQVVLSAWWTFEENGENWKTDLALADVWEV